MTIARPLTIIDLSAVIFEQLSCLSVSKFDRPPFAIVTVTVSFGCDEFSVNRKVFLIEHREVEKKRRENSFG